MRGWPVKAWSLGIACGWGVSALPASGNVLFSNGGLVTGELTRSGILAPAGTAWSETALDCANNQISNAVLGILCNQAAGFRVADDFSVPIGQSWTISAVRVHAYQTGSATTPTITGATLRIWNGPPGATGSQVVFGDDFTNRLLNASFASMYRIGSSFAPQSCGGIPQQPGLTRPLMEVRIDVGVTLGPGVYWLDWGLAGSLPSGPWTPPSTLAVCGRQADPNANALVHSQGVWTPIVDPGQGCQPPPVPQGLPFVIEGIGPMGTCYANCDGSTSVPFLNVNDFVCFQQLFASGSSTANCDGSTSMPILNVNDFVCFQQRFAAGCSSP